MEYKLNSDFLKNQNKSKYMIIILSLAVFSLLFYIATSNIYAIVALVGLAGFAVWLKLQHHKQEAMIDEYRVVIEQGKLTYYWPKGYSELSKGQIKKLSTKTTSKETVQITLIKTDEQVIALEGFNDMSKLIENIKQELSPEEVIQV